MVIDMEEDVRSIYRPSIWAKRLEAYKAAEAALRESLSKVREADEEAAKVLIEWADEYEENVRILESRKPISIMWMSFVQAAAQCREAIAGEQDNYTEVSTEVRGEDGKHYTLNVECNWYQYRGWLISPMVIDEFRQEHLLGDAEKFCEAVGFECSDADDYE